MKRALMVAIPVVLLALSARGQVIHGTPASITSIGGNGTFVGGPPASVTSISPPLPYGIARPLPGTGYISNPAFPSRGMNPGGFGHHHRPGNGGGVPIVAPYAYYPYVYPYIYSNDASYGYDYYGQQAGQQPVQVEIKIVNDKDREQDQYAVGGDGQVQVRRKADSENDAGPAAGNDQAESTQAAASQPPEPPREVIPTVLIFRDGHRQEVHNYAIMGSVLYDLESMTSRKIQLADLNLPATIKENDERGVPFTVPKK